MEELNVKINGLEIEIKNKMDNHEIEITSKNAQIMKLQNEIKVIQESLDNLRGENANIKSQNNKLEEENKINEENVINLKQECETKMRHEMNQKIQEKDEKIKHVHVQKEKKKEMIKEIQTMLTEVTEQKVLLYVYIY